MNARYELTDFQNQLPIAPPFTDKRNITIGKARVIYALSTGNLPDGWVLPGGRRTTDQFEARAHAVRMNDLITEISA